MLLLLGAAFVSLLAAEFVIRMVVPQNLYRYPQHLFVSYEPAGYRLASDFQGRADTAEYSTDISTDQNGFRVTLQPDVIDSSSRTILAIGDSFTMGVGVDAEDTYLEIIENELNSSSSVAKTQILNLGVPGYSTNQAIELLSDVGLRLEPDAILLSLFVGNDIVQNEQPSRAVVVNGYLRSQAPRAGLLPLSVRDFLQMNSHLYQLAWPIQRQIFDDQFRARQREAQEKNFSIYDASVAAEDPMWQASYDALARVADIGSDLNIPVLVAVIPEAIQLDPALWQLSADRLAEPGRQYERTHPARQIAEFCDQLELQCLDLLDSLPAYGDRQSLYFQIDGHWTKAGNDAAARILMSHFGLISPVSKVSSTQRN